MKSCSVDDYDTFDDMSIGDNSIIKSVRDLFKSKKTDYRYLEGINNLTIILTPENVDKSKLSDFNNNFQSDYNMNPQAQIIIQAIEKLLNNN